MSKIKISLDTKLVFCVVLVFLEAWLDDGNTVCVLMTECCRVQRMIEVIVVGQDNG